MKTAMQELIEYLEKSYYINELTNFDKDKIQFLEKEKEQIINEWRKGFDDAKYIYTPPTLHQNNQTYDGVNLHRFIKDEFDQTYNQNRLDKLENK
jgi:hypothetical protein